MSIDEILADYPDLEREDLLLVLNMLLNYRERRNRKKLSSESSC
jgi:uncharacterized protein (DUF433 family)